LIVAHVIGETGPNSRVIRAVDGIDERDATLGDLTSEISAPTLKKF
jgi:hypothetical protein